MPDVPELVRRDGVELIRTGSWSLSSGRWDASREDLAAAVAATACPAVRRPVIWIGHTDQRFTPRGGDGEPGVGWIENLRLADGGNTLVGDYVGVPAWLDQVMASAYPDRSVEGAYRRRCALGHTHPFVLDGVALLGVTRPGVGTLKSLQSLDDVKALYGLAASTAEVDGEVRVSATIPGRVEAAAEVHTGAMVALIPTEADAQRLAVDDGEPAEQLHVTLLYLGDAADFTAKARAAITDAVRRATVDTPTTEAHGFYVAAFNPPGSTPADGKQRDTCIVLGVGGEDLEYTQALAASAARHAALQFSVDLPEPHRPWAPHITLAYTDDLSRVAGYADRAGPVTFDRVRVAFGGEHVDIPLTAVEADPEIGPPLEVPNMLMPVAAASDAKLRAYWLTGKGAAKIRWNTPGDFTRCVRQLRKYVRDPKGLCAEYHRQATGVWPGDRRNVHASQEEPSVPNPSPDHAERVRAAWNASAPPQQWVTEVHPDHVIVCDETDRSFARVPVTASEDSVEFGQPIRVRPGYLPADDTIAASAVYASRDESRPDTPPDPNPDPEPPEHTPDAPDATPDAPATDGGSLVPPAAEPDNAPTTSDPKEDHVSDLSADVRDRLGLTDDADTAAILAAVDALKAKADANEQQVAASAAATDEMKTEIARLSDELATIKASAAADAKRALFDSAVQAGKLKPADREGWEQRYDRAPEVISEILASIAPNTAVPVAASGYTGGEPTGDDEFEQIVAALDGPAAVKGGN